MMETDTVTKTPGSARASRAVFGAPAEDIPVRTVSGEAGALRVAEVFSARARETAREARALPGAAAPHPVVGESDDEMEDDRGFFKRYGLVTGLGVVALGIVTAVVHLNSGHSAAPRRETSFTMVSLPPPPPPPPAPTPPPPQAPPEQKMIDQRPVAEPEAKPEDKPKDEPPKPKDEPGPIGTNVKGNGPADGFGLGGGNGLGGSGRGGGGTGSKWGWYAGQVQGKISEALRNNRKTRAIAIRVDVRIWPDQTGRVTRAQLASSTGDAAVDAAIRDEILTGLQLQEPPPAGLPTPIVLRLTARRP